MERLSLERQPPRALVVVLVVFWLLVLGSFAIYVGWHLFGASRQGTVSMPAVESTPPAQDQFVPGPLLTRLAALMVSSPITPTSTPLPTATATQTVTPTPTITPTPVTPEPPFPTPIVDLTDRRIYTTTLKPGFAADVDAVPDAPHYFIQAMLIPDESPFLTGIERVRYTNQEAVPLDEVYFRLYPNLPAYGGSATVNRVIVDSQLITPTLEYGNSALRVPLTQPLQPGEATDITVWFYATLPTHVQAGSAGSGLYGFVEGVYDLAGFYPTIPVYDDTGWNLGITATFGDSTFTDTSFYHVQLTVPADQEVIASGTTVGHHNNGDGTRTWDILAGPVRAFYAATSSRYLSISQDVGETTVNSYYMDGGIAGAQTALDYATRSLAVFNDLFGEYPYRELDVIAMPTTGFGMEYPGVIAIANRFYGAAGGPYAEAVIHEVAHQWWYNLVGNDQPDDPWLDESLANYSFYLYFDAIDWVEVRDSIMNNSFRYRYQAAQNLGIDRPVAGPVTSFDASNYINIVYSKGPLFFHEVRKRMGDEPFFAALADYARTHRYGIAYPQDLMAAFHRHTDQPLDDLYNFWIGEPLPEP